MSVVFDVNHEKLATDPRFADIGVELNKLSLIDSSEAFNRYCREACRLWREQFDDAPVGKTSAQFAELLGRVDRGGDGIIQTSWGGVVITTHEHPRVEKHLVIRKGGYLALETHEEKDEHLEVKEGAGLLLWRRVPNQALTVEPLAPGDQFHFEPGVEHCLIGTEKLLVFERSVDPKGMDQDLVFIYTPDAVSESKENVDSRSPETLTRLPVGQCSPSAGFPARRLRRPTPLRAGALSEPEANARRPMQKEP